MSETETVLALADAATVAAREADEAERAAEAAIESAEARADAAEAAAESIADAALSRAMSDRINDIEEDYERWQSAQALQAAEVTAALADLRASVADLQTRLTELATIRVTTVSTQEPLQAPPTGTITTETTLPINPEGVDAPVAPALEKKRKRWI